MARLAQELRDAILQAAIEGKLAENNPQERCPEILFGEPKESIDGRRVKSKTIAHLDLSEVPFETPNNWRWVRLGQTCTVARGGSPRPIKEYITQDEDGINWIKIGDTEKGGKYITSVREKIKPSGVTKSRQVKAGDFLLTNSMSFGRPYILKVDGCIHDGWLVISQETTIFDADYLYWLLSSKYAYHQFSDQVSGAVVKNLNSEKVANSVFPLPPIEEQQRIVDRVDELMAKIDEFEIIENELEALKAAFPGEMKEALLQAALEGKLTLQFNDDSNVDAYISRILDEKPEAKKCKEIKEEDILFDIPDNWRWVRFGSIVSHNTGKALNSSNKEGEVMEYITTSNLYWNRFELGKLKTMPFKESEVEKCSVSKGDLLVCEGGDVGRAAIWPYDFKMRIQNHIHKIRAYSELNMVFYYYMFYLYKHAGYISGKGIGIKGLSSKALHNLMAPLPPIEEQQRIVDRLEELLPLCDELENLQ